jgi:carboxymethylenebutenolidase
MSRGALHAFNNDTSNRYDKAAADLAWSRIITFFKQELGAPPSG